MCQILGNKRNRFKPTQIKAVGYAREQDHDLFFMPISIRQLAHYLLKYH